MKRNIIYYDNVCVICSNFKIIIEFLSAKDKFTFKPLIDNKQLSNNNNTVFETIIFINNNKEYKYLDALIEIFFALNKLFVFFRILYILPFNLRIQLYQILAKNRYIFGVKDSCDLHFKNNK